MPERVLVIGATSRVAEEILLLHDARGDHTFLLGRNKAKLASIEARLAHSRGSFAFDFLETAKVAEALDAARSKLSGFDRVIIAHGLLTDQLATERDYAAAHETFAANLLSVVAFVVPIANELEANGAGRLCVLGSVAGERGRPRNYTYGAAKGALHVYLEGVRSRLFPRVSVTTIKLGPVDTPMTTDHEKNFLFSRPDDVARAIVAATDAKAGNVFVPGYFRLILWVVRALPEVFFQKIASLSGR